MLNWILHQAPTPERQAERALREVRLQLFQAEQRILEAQLHADYYRERLAFLEAVAQGGIERISERRAGAQDNRQAPHPGFRLTAAQ
ncbi:MULTISPECIES: hypothetical protein [Cupriavidus]